MVHAQFKVDLATFEVSTPRLKVFARTCVLLMYMDTSYIDFLYTCLSTSVTTLCHIKSYNNNKKYFKKLI